LVGDWYEDIIDNIKNLEKEKRYMNEEFSHRKRIAYKNQMVLLSATITMVSTLLVVKSFFNSDILDKINIEVIVGFIGIIISGFIVFRTKTQVSAEKEQDRRQIMARELETEIERYKTLIETDPRIKEHIYDRESTTHNKELR
jgi:uncharacterized membrane protein